MRFRFALSALSLAAAASSSQAAVVLSEGFTNVAGLTASGWAFVNNSTSAATGQTWFQGNTAVFTAAAGPASSYAAANFLSTGASNGAVSNWLFTPVVTMHASTSLSYALRLVGDGFLDTVEVYYSTSGASTNVGTTPTSTGVFSLLSTINSTADTGWTAQSANLASLVGSSTGRFAFRYFVNDISVNGNYVGLDSVTVSVPEPASYGLVALGLLAAGLARRKAG